MKADDIRNINSESGVLSTLAHHPDFYFHTDQLRPEHFGTFQNQCLYLGLSLLAQQEVKHIDAYNIISVLESSDATRRYSQALSIDDLQEFIEVSDTIARGTLEEYKILVGNVMECAKRRDIYKQLKGCEALCFKDGEQDLEQKIYSTIDDVLMLYSTHSDVPRYSEVVDKCWSEIEARQGTGGTGIPFKFPALNEYVTIERGELVLFAAEAKMGKSIMLTNCAVDLLRNGYAVLYLDSELNDRMFTARIISHITGIEFKRVKSGTYTAEEAERIRGAISWLKQDDVRFTHCYIPVFDVQSIYTAVKKIYHTTGIDVVITDYFKSSGVGDAFESYQELGRFVDMVKNRICGEMNLAGLGAAQATAAGKIADSAKIARNASTIIYIRSKDPGEIQTDGEECGNKKLFVALNRNGMQMTQDEYIDLKFDGNRILFEQAKQHIPVTPF